jgi:hypothetical protein
MKTITQRLLVLGGLLSLLFAVPAAQAEHGKDRETSREEWKQHSEEVFSKIEDRRDKKLDRCEAVETKLKERETEDNRLQGKHREQYTKLVDRITDLITRAKAGGYDTTALEAELVVLKAKIATFNTDKDSYIAALKASQDDVCGKSEGEFKDAVVGARTEREQLKDSAQAVHDYVKDTIKPTIRALKKALEPSPSPEA